MVHPQTVPHDPWLDLQSVVCGPEWDVELPVAAEVAAVEECSVLVACWCRCTYVIYWQFSHDDCLTRYQAWAILRSLLGCHFHREP